MPSESFSRWTWTRIACVLTRSPLARLLLFPALAMGPCACASHPTPQALATTRDTLAGLDEFGALLLGAGLPVEAIPKERSVSPEQAERLRRYFAILPFLPQHYAPRFVADELLRFVEGQDESVLRWDLSLKVQEYRNLFILRPDGYLAAALTGEPAKCVGPVEVRDSGTGADGFEMGRFYTRPSGETWPRADSPKLDTK